MSGLEIALTIIGIFFIGGGYCAFEFLCTKKQREEQQKNDDAFWDLITEFDEMGYEPTTLCDDSEKEAQEFKKRLIKLYNKKS